jgi:hypothetical protein
VIVYTAIYGDYDNPKPPRPHPGVSEWRLYTDKLGLYAPGWRVIVEPRSLGLHPRMRAKWRKCYPPGDAGVSLYLDGSIRLWDQALVGHVYEALEHADWCCYPHPERTTVEQEVEASLPMAKYQGLAEKMKAQAAFYSAQSRVAPGLWAAGILGRRREPAVLAAGAAWYAECERWTYQDQISLPYVLATHGLVPRPLTLGGGLWNNQHFVVEPHQSDR